MNNCKSLIVLGTTLLAASLLPTVASAQTRETLFDLKGLGGSASPEAFPMPCRGNVRMVEDVTFEGVKTTSWTYPTGATGYDPVPVLSYKVSLKQGCFNLHLSAMVGGSQSYGMNKITLFQVRVTPASGPPIILDGHYPTCYGALPCVALSAEHDVDMLSSNFYKNVSSALGQIPPGPALVEVLWAGGPSFLNDPNPGAIGAAFVAKMYHY
jgi:hypothetical protein